MFLGLADHEEDTALAPSDRGTMGGLRAWEVRNLTLMLPGPLWFLCSE